MEGEDSPAQVGAHDCHVTVTCSRVVYPGRGDGCASEEQTQ